jgi:16S rRNA (cytosine1402-N4)-methyltransferase
MAMGLNKTSAYEFINKASQELLADVIFYYGEEHTAKRIAKRIIDIRVKEEIKTTKQLADIVRGVVGFKKGKVDPATKTFQAIRIYINDELHQLQEALKNSYNYR